MERRLSSGASQLQVTHFEYEVELPRFLSQVGSAESWATDFLTREKVHVADHCIAVDVQFAARFVSAPAAHDETLEDYDGPATTYL